MGGAVAGMPPGQRPRVRSEGRTLGIAKRRGASSARPTRDGCRQEVERDGTHQKPDREVFTRETLPLVEGVSLSKMKAATGLSATMCAKIRRGYVPHPRHWEGLLAAVSGSLPRAGATMSAAEE